ncbi:gluconate 2-dehydrogenase subunit 3 family protein [Alteromonas sp. RKMC-009]|uniref:gluconate 2-dehydrogenase subunit 3 family protein n=1 Tax=Alteromonas sp. RKMC-009 TaxID=2267264 RepID=UPI000E693AFA|nr:gluconate 2-dehydrogenase subunit 3 family protein [Alteromonas sp. RKMC-009]AYA63543.1 gluconate 2-dehydrogenase subunit 3 family protein [Alteromonas sp. RKMC-009]
MNNIFHISRRQLLCILGAGLGASAFASISNNALLLKQDAESANEELSLLAEICDILIPDTTSKGAVAANVPAFVHMAFQHQLFGGSVDTVVSIGSYLNSKSPSGNFLLEDEFFKRSIIELIDKTTFSKSQETEISANWKIIKEAVIVGYYTSEIGGAEELTYLPVAGSMYRADIAFKDTPHVSNLWMENAF